MDGPQARPARLGLLPTGTAQGPGSQHARCHPWPLLQLQAALTVSVYGACWMGASRLHSGRARHFAHAINGTTLGRQHCLQHRARACRVPVPGAAEVMPD